MYECATIDGSVCYISRKLNLVTKEIRKLGTATRKASYRVAVLLAEAKRDVDFTQEGYKDVTEYSEAEFGFKKTQTYNLVTVGERFVACHYSEKGKLTDISLNPNIFGDNIDYGMSQLIILSAMSDDEITGLIAEGKITPAMSCRELAKLVKSLKVPATNEAIEEEVSEEEAPEEEAPEEEAPEEEVSSNYVSVWDVDGKEYLIPADVLKMYRKSY